MSFGGVGEDGNDDNSKYQPTQHNNHCLKYLFKDKSWPQKYSRLLENRIRNMVREELDDALKRSSLNISRSLQSWIVPSEFRQFKLLFEGRLPGTLFTLNKVEAEGPSPVKILLLDAVSGRPIKEGPLSYKKVEVLVLQGDFKAEELEEWTKCNFYKQKVPQRNNKGTLLAGQCVIALHNGIGIIEDICFTDNSSWVRSKMFRLGARIVAEEDQVREAVSNPFQVKDRRGESYQKHNIPSIEDEVWRLRQIAKDGKICKALEENQIYKVKDLIKHYRNDESSLQRIVGVPGKKWKEIIEHATSCTDLNNLDKINIPSTSTINPITIPCANLQQFCPNDQEEIQMTQSYGGEQSHQLADQSMAQRNPLLNDFLTGPANDVCLPSLDCMSPSSSTMFNVQNSNWLTDQLIKEDGIEIFSTIPMSMNALEITNPETSLEDEVVKTRD